MDVQGLLRQLSGQTQAEEQILGLIQTAGWADRPGIMRHFRFAQRTGDWKILVELLRNRLRDVQEFHEFIEVPTETDVAGEIFNGHVVLADWSLAYPAGFSVDDAFTHVAYIGPTGSGKTVVSRLTALQLHNLGTPVWIFDTEDQFKNVVAYSEPGSWLVLDISKGEFKRNPWQPSPCGTFLDVDSRMRDALRQRWVGEGGTGIESEVALELNAEQGLFTMRQFYERLKRRRARTRDWTEQRYIASLLNRISDLNLHLSGTYEVLEGYPLEEMMARSIVFRLANLSADNVFFFVVELLSAVSDSRRQERADYPGLVILVDEAQRFFKAADHSQTAMYPLMLDHVQTFRKRRLILILATQDVFDVPRAVTANAGVSLYFRPLDGESSTKIAKSLSMTPDQAKCFMEMPARYAVMRHPRFMKAFMIRIPELSLEEPVSDDQIAEMMSPILASLKWIPSPFAKTAVPNAPQSSVARNEDRDEARHSDNGSAVSRDVESAMSSDSLGHLEDLGEHPFEGSTDGDKRRGVSLGVGNARRQKFIALGLIKEHQVRLVRRGNATKLIEVTDKGWAVLEQYKRKAKRPAGRGSFVHQAWQHKIAEYVRASLPGAKVTIEDQTTGKAVDVLVRLDNKVIGIEISETTRPEDELRNVVADLGFCDLVFVLAEGERHLQSINEVVSRELSAADLKRVSGELLREFISRPFPQPASLP